MRDETNLGSPFERHVILFNCPEDVVEGFPERNDVDGKGVDEVSIAQGPRCRLSFHNRGLLG